MNRYDQRVSELQGELAPRTFIGPQVNLSERELIEIEQKIGFPLPRDYRDFLRDYGQFGFFGGATFPIRDRRNGVHTASLEIFLGYGHPFDLVSEYLNLIDMDVLPREMLPIADNAGGSHVCIALEGENRGRVYFWISDEAESPPTYDNIYLVADNFEEFFQLIYLRE